MKLGKDSLLADICRQCGVDCEGGGGDEMYSYVGKIREVFGGKMVGTV